MPQFRWTQDNEVFIAEIDAEHRNLFDIADAFGHATEGQAHPAEAREHLNALAAHLEQHFSHEEWLMRSVAYPSYGWHKQQHDTIRRRLKLFVPLIESGNREAVDVFLEFLAGWLHDHTSVTDRMMAAYVRNYERAHQSNTQDLWTSAGAAASRRRNVVAPDGPHPKTIRFCKICGEQTTHELRPGELACQKCAESSIRAELDRD